MNKPKVFTCDIDSTIADTRHRWHMVKHSENPDWLAYANACKNDTPVNVYNLRSLLPFFGELIFVSSRPGGARTETLKWLNKLNVPFLALVLDDDEMALGDFKVKALRQISETYDIQFHVDDNLLVKEAIETELGIRVIVWSAYDD